jgi:hypothetical protein
MSIRRAFGLAMQPANIREDLAALPWLVRSTKAVWVPTAIVAITGLLYVAAPRQAVIATIATTLLAPPSLIPPFLAGLLAPRAAWLAGLIVGFVSGLAVVIVTLAQTGLGLTSAEVTTEALLFFVAVSPMFGLGVGAFAGFYRRFLRFTAPPPGARRRGSAKPAPRGR